MGWAWLWPGVAGLEESSRSGLGWGLAHESFQKEKKRPSCSAGPFFFGERLMGPGWDQPGQYVPRWLIYIPKR